MTRPLTRGQHLENPAFMKALRRTGNIRTGNIRLAARELGMSDSTLRGAATTRPKCRR